MWKLKELKSRYLTITPSGEVLIEDEETSLVAICGYEEEEDRKLMLKLFFYERLISPKGNSRRTKPKMFLYTAKYEDVYYVIVDRRQNEMDQTLIVGLNKIITRAYEYTNFHTVMREIYEVYKGVVLHLESNILTYKILYPENIDRLYESVLYYSQPENLTIFERRPNVNEDKNSPFNYKYSNKDLLFEKR